MSNLNIACKENVSNENIISLLFSYSMVDEMQDTSRLWSYCLVTCHQKQITKCPYISKHEM